MTRSILSFAIVLLLCVSAHAQQPVQPGTPQTAPATPVQPGQTAPPSKPAQNPQAAAPPTAAAQQADTRTRIVRRTELVIVPVTVKSRDGQLVGDLQRDEFRIFSDGAEQQIVLFDSQPFPLSAVVLLDNDLAEKEAEQVKKSLDAIAGGFGANDEVALVTYAEFPETVSDFSFNNDSLFTALKRLDLSAHSTTIINDPTTAGPIINGQTQPDGTGTTGQGGVQVRGFGKAAIHNSLDDAIYAAGQMLKGRGRDRRKIIFLITDGSNTHNNQHSFNETLHSLLLADVSVFAISVTHQTPVGRSIIQHGAAEVDKYAAATGGDTFYAAKGNDLSRLYSAVTEQARNVYTITFAPQEADRTKDYHTIEVRVRRPDLDVTARQGYFQAGLH
ncbi:MAG TPA: VWA domain-containing protein [Candidatus Acidoferrales bacterium]|nr:VWA domain-containing protein [Candidatus Acidoferrales bacterium]